MKLSLRNIVTLPCLAAFLAVAGTAHGASIVNGSFASGDLTGWTTNGINGTTPGIGITVITLGTANNTGFGDNVPVDGSATHAVYFVDDNAHVETLSQMLNLDAATTYTVTFDLFGTTSGSGNQFNYSLTDSLGTSSSIFTNTTVPVGVWTSESLAFTTVAGGNYTLSFAFDSGDTPAKDVLLTNINILSPQTTSTPPVPEPGSLALFGTGVLGLAGAVRRKLFVRS